MFCKNRLMLLLQINSLSCMIYPLGLFLLKFKYNVENEISVIKGDDWITNQQISEPTVGDDGLSTVTVSYQLGELR